MGFRSLRVINDDYIAPGKGFGMHPHSSMEIFTYVISGELEHKDSMGNGRIIKAGEFQYMSAGEGVLHSEKNPSTEETHLLQIWITPKTPGGEPRYADMNPVELKKPNDLTLFASGSGRGNSFAIRQDTEISFGQLDQGSSLDVAKQEKHPYMWLQIIKGSVSLNDDQVLEAGDAAALDHSDLNLIANEESEFLLFQLS